MLQNYQDMVELERWKIANVIAHGSNSSSVDLGQIHYVFKFLHSKQSSIMRSDSICYIIHKAVKHACKHLSYDMNALVIRAFNEF